MPWGNISIHYNYLSRQLKLHVVFSTIGVCNKGIYQHLRHSFIICVMLYDLAPTAISLTACYVSVNLTVGLLFINTELHATPSFHENMPGFSVIDIANM